MCNIDHRRRNKASVPGGDVSRAAGHLVYASMRDPRWPHAERRGRLCRVPTAAGEVRIVSLDVLSEESATERSPRSSPQRTG